MTADFQRFVETEVLSPDQIAACTRSIGEVLLRDSPYLDEANFTLIHPDDVGRLFDLYDARFFHGVVRKLLADTPLTFRLSPRMTQAGGKTTRRQLRYRGCQHVETRYEIGVSTTLLFQSFQDDCRPVTLCGIECRDRLSALHRIVEHEMVHLIEMLLWRKSSCAAKRFQSIAGRFFGHTSHRHQLVTSREVALKKFGIRPGDNVTFEIDGQRQVGLVNRITKRATVLVEHHRGQPFTNGKRYETYYVPLDGLKRVDA